MRYSSDIKVKKAEVMSHRERVIYYLLVSVGIFLTTIFGAWWFAFSHIPSNFQGIFHGIDIILFISLSYVVWYQIINEIFSWAVANTMKHPVPLTPQKGQKVAFLTAFVPGSEPYEMLETTLKAMKAVNYSHDTWLLDEGNDAEAKRICKLYGVKHYTRKGSPYYNTSSGPYKVKSKGGNYNSWFHQHGNEYEFVAQIDIDFIPKKDFLTKTLGYFRDPNVAFVGSPQVYGNTDESWIAKGAAEQAYGFYGSMQKGFFGSDMQLFIGANHVVRVKAHNSIDGYAGHIVEDHLTGMKFYSHRWKSVYVPEILAIGEGPASWDSYFSQQMRWAYGLIDILLTQSPKLFGKMRMHHVANYFLLQQYYFYGVAQIIGVVLLTLYFFFGIQATTMHLLPLILLYVPILLWQQVLFFWLQRFNINPKEESGFMLNAKFLNWAAWPIYFLAFIGAITRKRLTYKVTPKGKEQNIHTNISLFLPHFILGSFTFIDIIASVYLHHLAIQLLFWAFLNTIVMYYFVFNEVLKKIMPMVHKQFSNFILLFRFNRLSSNLLEI